MKEANAFAVREDVHMRAYIALFVNNAIEHAWRSSPERRESVTNRLARLIDLHYCFPINRQPKRFRQLDRNHCPLMTAVFTHTTGGNPSASSRHVAPSSIEPNSLPLRVPK